MRPPSRTSLGPSAAVLTLLLIAGLLPILFGGSASVNAGSAITSVRAGKYPIGVAFDSSNGNLYVANYHSASVSVINESTNKVVATVPVGSYPWGVAFDPSNGDIYVANDGSNTTSVIDGSTNTVVATVPVGGLPIGVVYDPSNGNVYVVNDDSNSTSVIDGSTNTVTATVTVGFWPYAAAYDPANGDVYVTNIGAGTVSVIAGSNDTVVATIGTGNPYSYPEGIAFDSSNGYLYLVEDGLNATSIINGSSNSIVGTVQVGAWPEWAAFDPLRGDIYVTNTASGTVSVIGGSSNTVVRTLKVGSRPYGAEFDPANGYVYVANVGSGTVSVIKPNWVSQPIQLIVAGPGHAATLSLSGCSVSPRSISANGTTQTITAAPNCKIAVHLSTSSTSRYVTSTGSTVALVKTCASGTCSTSSAVITQQFRVTFVASGSGRVHPPAGWFDAGSTVALTATPYRNHSFLEWTSSTSMISIANPSASSTTAAVDGAGTVTATFS